MGRIAEELAKASKTESTKSTSNKELRKGNSLSVTGSINADEGIDFARLPNVSPDENCLTTHRIVAAQTDSPDRAVYKVLRTRVLQRLRASQWSMIGVTGTGPGEGKTVTAINLAYSLAQDVNHNVILIDLDLRRPSLHTYLGIEPQYDLSDYLNGSKNLEEILVRPGEKRLALVTNQTTYRDSSEVLSAPELGALVHQLKKLGPKTVTIFDLPPALAGDDVLAFAPLIDALLLVVAEGTCRREHLAEAKELLKDINILGAVLNRSREKTPSSGYYDYYD
jgi:Mrp family chromosome partitioning ATPase